MSSTKAKSGFFASVRRGLFMTHTEILEKLGTAVKSGLGLDDSVFNALEEALIAADTGSETAEALVGALKARAGEISRPDADTLRRMLAEEIEKLLAQGPKPPSLARSPMRQSRYGDGAASSFAKASEDKSEDEPEVVFLVGVNGSGKTTTTAKLARRRVEDGQRVLLAAADTFRAGAIEQLEIWGERLGLDVIRHKEGADPSAVLFDALSAAKARRAQVLFVDTAGRLHTKQNLMEELAKMRRIAAREVPGAPHQTLLVLDATTGGNGLAQARRFVEAVGATGVVLTKLDGSARGGIVLAIYQELKLPVLYVGVGEGADDLVPFDPADYAKALLGDD
jgi:fused signal recognition particle receptor